MEGTKVCTVCKKEFPSTDEFFYKEKRVKDGLKAKCKACFKEENKQYNHNHYDLEKKRQYINTHKEYYKKVWKEYRTKNKIQIAKQKQDYYNRNKQKLLISIKNYQHKHKNEMLFKQGITRRIRRTDEKLHYSLKEWNECKEYFDNCCAYCGKKSERLEKEHFIPFKHGGEYSRFNIIPSCKSCNSSKNDKNFFEWYPIQKYYSVKREQKILKYLKYDKNNNQQIALII